MSKYEGKYEMTFSLIKTIAMIKLVLIVLSLNIIFIVTKDMKNAILYTLLWWIIMTIGEIAGWAIGAVTVTEDKGLKKENDNDKV